MLSELSLFLEIVIYALVVLSLVYSVRIARMFADGSLGGIFYYITASVFMLGLHRVFQHAAEEGLYALAEVDVYVWSHLIFYFGIAAFILGVKKLHDIASSSMAAPFRMRDVVTIAALCIASLAVFFVAQPLEPALSASLVGSVVDTLGLHHFLAFLLAAFAGYYVWKSQSAWGSMFRVSVYPFIAFLVLVGVLHLWETLAESWKLIPVSHSGAESVEQLILLPLFALFAVALSRIHSFLQVAEA